MLALSLLAPASVCALLLVWFGPWSGNLRWTVTTIVLLSWLIGAFTLRERASRPLQTLANLVGAIGEGDFSIRARGADPNNDLGLAYFEVNALAQALRRQRLGSLEAEALLRRVIVEIDAAIFAFDADRRLRLVNRAGAALLDARPEPLIGRSAASLGLDACLTGDSPRMVEIAFPGKNSRWEIRRSSFRQEGRPHQLLVLNDVGAVLREQERQSWQQVIRVLSHEVNNSLAPIKSIAESLTQAMSRGTPQPPDMGDLQSGLGVIASRSESLRRFMSSYAQLARLPRPRLDRVAVAELAQRAAPLEQRLPVTVTGGPDVTVRADADQLEQVLINLLRNAADAALETAGGVRLGWRMEREQVAITVDDDGPGLPSTANLFVPFFTTKPNGTGIGLILSRQIVEAHGGTLTLANRPEGGCRAELRLMAGG